MSTKNQPVSDAPMNSDAAIHEVYFTKQQALDSTPDAPDDIEIIVKHPSNEQQALPDIVFEHSQD
jgi:hypothetical protein